MSLIKVMKWEAPLNYANAEYFVEEVYKSSSCFPEEIKKEMNRLRENRTLVRKIISVSKWN